mmetsp:Transcript_29568/g.70435  ORF Transcript_29568/g.70435 Transcript_29568/m.70435 type:complete len:260 (-) Transcript_29568:794-1573(-)
MVPERWNGAPPSRMEVVLELLLAFRDRSTTAAAARAAGSGRPAPAPGTQCQDSGDRRGLIAHGGAPLVDLDHERRPRAARRRALAVQRGEVGLVRRHEPRHEVGHLLVRHRGLARGAHLLLGLEPPLVHALRVVHPDDKPAVDPAVPSILVPSERPVHRHEVLVHRRDGLVRLRPESQHPALKEHHVKGALDHGPLRLGCPVAEPRVHGLVVAGNSDGAVRLAEFPQRRRPELEVVRRSVAPVLQQPVALLPPRDFGQG